MVLNVSVITGVNCTNPKPGSHIHVITSRIICYSTNPGQAASVSLAYTPTRTGQFNHIKGWIKANTKSP